MRTAVCSLKTEALEADARFDEIGSALKIKGLQRDKESFWNLWKCITRYFFWGDIPDEELKKKAEKKMQLRNDP